MVTALITQASFSLGALSKSSSNRLSSNPTQKNRDVTKLVSLTLCGHFKSDLVVFSKNEKQLARECKVIE